MKFASKLIIALTAAASLAGYANTASAESYQGHRGYHARQHEVLLREGYNARDQRQAWRHNDRAIAMRDHGEGRASGR